MYHIRIQTCHLSHHTTVPTLRVKNLMIKYIYGRVPHSQYSDAVVSCCYLTSCFLHHIDTVHKLYTTASIQTLYFVDIWQWLQPGVFLGMFNRFSSLIFDSTGPFGWVDRHLSSHQASPLLFCLSALGHCPDYWQKMKVYLDSATELWLSRFTAGNVLSRWWAEARQFTVGFI